MRRGEESLKLELLRRRAKSEEEAAAVLMPPKASLVVRILALNRKE
jgi:hypothetical protein